METKEKTANACGNRRREQVLARIGASSQPVTAAVLAAACGVSRQVIVGDVSLLRAEGHAIRSTPRGYLMGKEESFPFVGTLVCRHDNAGMEEELNTIVDYGGTCIDVSIEHAIYGEFMGQLNISSRYDVRLFMEKIQGDSKPLSLISGGVHTHRIGCRDEEIFYLIRDALDKKHILFEGENA